MIEVLIEGMTNNKGGKETYIINVFKMIDKSKFNFTFIAYDDEIAYEDYIRETGAEVVHLPSRDKGLFQFRKALDDLFNKRHFDVVWAHKTTLSSCEFLEIAKKHKVKLRIVHSHSSSNMGGRLTFILHSINKILIKKWANEFFACSESAAKWFYRNNEYKIMTNGIDVEKFRFDPEVRKRIRKELGLEDSFTIGHVGRFGIEKNHIKLINVFNEVKKINSNAKLVLCGDGEERANIEAQIKKLHLNDSVLLLGIVDNVNEVLQAVDIMVMPSLFEGLPFALLEAQAAGLKCVVSDTVSKESDIMEWNRFIPLSYEDDKWAKIILDSATSFDRSIGADIIRKKGFNLSECVKHFEKYVEERVITVY